MSKFKVPHTLVLLFGMILLAYALTWILPQGEFDTVQLDNGREQVVSGTYKTLETPERLPWYTVFKIIPRGFQKVEEIIFFVFLIGGAFGVLRFTGAIDAMIGLLLPILGRASWLFIVGGMVLFAAGASTIGMAEEYLPFVPILLALAIGLGFDSVTAIGVLCIGYGVGYGAAVFNPFTVLIAQAVADVPLNSGAGYRLILTVFFLAIGIHHVWRYAMKVKKDPSQSLVADLPVDPKLENQEHPPFTLTHGLVLGATVVTLGIIVYGLSELGWYVHELGAMFLGLSVAYIVISRLAPSDAAKQFCHGASELTTTALLIGFANSILLILQDGKIIDTVVNGVAQPLAHVGTAGAAIGMLFFQSLCNFFIPSGSGQAYVTMPVMSPIADLVGVQRQVAVLAYQIGDGITNIVVPTNAVLIGILDWAGIPYDRWLRFIFPFMIKIMLAGSLAMAVAVWIGYS